MAAVRVTAGSTVGGAAVGAAATMGAGGATGTAAVGGAAGGRWRISITFGPIIVGNPGAWICKTRETEVVPLPRSLIVGSDPVGFCDDAADVGSTAVEDASADPVASRITDAGGIGAGDGAGKASGMGGGVGAAEATTGIAAGSSVGRGTTRAGGGAFSTMRMIGGGRPASALSDGSPGRGSATAEAGGTGVPSERCKTNTFAEF